MADLQRVMLDIEEQAVDFLAVLDPPEPAIHPLPPNASSTKISANDSTTSHDRETPVLPLVPLQEKPPGKLNSDSISVAGRKVLKQLESPAETTLLLLSESPLSPSVPGGVWGTVFAELTIDPILVVGVVQQPPASKQARRHSGNLTGGGKIPGVTQSEHPGLCTLSTSCSSLCGMRAAEWWTVMRSQFGMILLDGSGLDITTLTQLLSKCSDVLFVVEYGKTSRNWAAQTRKAIASRNITPLGCIARSADGNHPGDAQSPDDKDSSAT